MTAAEVLDELNATREILDRIRYRTGYLFEAGVDEDHIYIELRHYRLDVDTDRMGWGRGGRRYLQPHLCESAVVRIALGAAISYEEHEVRENFLYRGKRIFGPHIDVEALAEVADRTAS